MRALTLWRPWTWAICRPSPRAKRVENRTWAPPAWLWKQYLAIHAGKKYDDGDDTVRFVAELLGEYPPPARRCPEGIVAVVRVAGFRDELGVHWFAELPQHDGGDWFCGPVGWLFDRVCILPHPVACIGHQGLWNLPPGVEAEVRRQLGEEKA